MITYQIEIQGESPLLCNRFTEEAMEKLSKGSSSAITIGNRGTPRDQAEKKLYGTIEQPVIPGPNLYRSIVDAGRFHKAGKVQVTTVKSSLVPAGIWMVEIECPIRNPDNSSPQWEVDQRSVVNPATGGRMLCCRPRFDSWRIAFTLQVDESMFDEKIVRVLVDDAGQKIGLGDFRPARKGPFGRFKVISWTKTKAVRS